MNKPINPEALPLTNCSEIIKFADEPPPNDYDYACVIVFADGYETKSDGGTVHDCCVKSGIAYGWRRYIPNAKHTHHHERKG